LATRAPGRAADFFVLAEGTIAVEGMFASQGASARRGGRVEDMAVQIAGELLLNIPDGASSIAGASSATVTGTNFEEAGEIIRHPDGSAIANSNIVATCTVITASGTASTIVTLPDGTVITLVGLAAVTPVLFTP
jgi:hypothetical protein